MRDLWGPGVQSMPTSPLTLPARTPITFGLRLSEQQHASLKRLAAHYNCAPSVLARLCLAKGLAELEADTTEAA